ncbi:ABC transporter ATP-binding protein [Faecalicatena orotica]|nr:ABC transporter ATP-binding protein [Faecalicatena orotica]
MSKFECRNITKSYKNFTLQDISFMLESGYLAALIGPNGSGKTTLFRCISGTARRMQGEAVIDGISLSQNPAAYKEKIGYISENLSFFQEQSILENGQNLGIYFPEWSLEDYYFWLDKMELAPSRKVYQLSKGEAMKMQFCFALAHQPRFLFLDEPMAGFDPVFRRDFLAILKDVLEKDIGILLSTHITEDLDKLADYVLVLKNGRLIRNDTKESLEDQYRRSAREKNPDADPFKRFHIKDLLS